jgi:SET domain-containing protein 6
MGSRILSRSFHVEKWEGEDDENPLTTNGTGCAMDVDEETSTFEAEAEVREETEESDDDSEGEDVEDPSDVAMVPMADILNARYGSDNVCIFIRAPFTVIIHNNVPRLNSSMKKKTSK